MIQVGLRLGVFFTGKMPAPTAHIVNTKLLPMKSPFISILAAAITLLLFSFVAVFVIINILPEYSSYFFTDVFWPEGLRAVMFYLHPFILSIALGWFWNRFKGSFKGQSLVRGIELGLTYLLVAIIPMLWITFSSLHLETVPIVAWSIYGFLQASIAGFVFAKLNP